MLTYSKDMHNAALIVIDVQNGFDDPRWGARNNPQCESHIIAALDAWRNADLPVVLVRHDSTSPTSPLAPGQPGNDFKPGVAGTAALTISKHTNSAFYGDPSLESWLRDNGITDVVICGITTDHCCSTTARMAANLGFTVWFVGDATHTFDRTLPDGTIIGADEVARVNMASLHDEFATVITTAQLLEKIGA